MSEGCINLTACSAGDNKEPDFVFTITSKQLEELGGVENIKFSNEALKQISDVQMLDFLFNNIDRHLILNGT